MFKNKLVLPIFFGIFATVTLLVTILFFKMPTHRQLDRRAEEFGGGVIEVSAGWFHSAATTADGGVWTWGSNAHGQIGNDCNSRSSTPIERRPLRIMDNVIFVATGNHSTLSITSSGELWIWGRVGFDPLETGMVLYSGSIPYPVRVVDDIVHASIGEPFTVFITSDGILRGWGIRPSPNHLTTVDIMSDVIYVSAGRNHAMFITSDNALWGWGSNQDGQLGDGTTDRNPYPVRIMENIAFVSPSRGSEPSGGHTMAIASDGTLWAWGANQSGQLGDGTRTSRFFPVQITQGFAPNPYSILGYDPNILYAVDITGEVIYVSAGGAHTMAITTDGTLWGWGENFSGQLGNGTNLNSNVPVRIMENVVAVSAGMAHTLAVTENGELWAWGDNSHGQLGDGTRTNRNSPIRIK